MFKFLKTSDQLVKAEGLHGFKDNLTINYCTF